MGGAFLKLHRRDWVKTKHKRTEFFPFANHLIMPEEPIRLALKANFKTEKRILVAQSAWLPEKSSLINWFFWAVLITVVRYQNNNDIICNLDEFLWTTLTGLVLLPDYCSVTLECLFWKQDSKKPVFWIFLSFVKECGASVKMLSSLLCNVPTSFASSKTFWKRDFFKYTTYFSGSKNRSFEACGVTAVLISACCVC